MTNISKAIKAILSPPEAPEDGADFEAKLKWAAASLGMDDYSMEDYNRDLHKAVRSQERAWQRCLDGIKDLGPYPKELDEIFRKYKKEQEKADE